MKSKFKAARLEFESPLPHKNNHLKPAPVAGFIKSEGELRQNCAKTTPSMSQYRKPRLVKGSRGYYIEYYYLIPLDLLDLYPGKKWLRFRIVEDMNRRKGADRQEYAAWLLTEITNSLKRGYNPFKPEMQILEDLASEHEQPAITDADKALRLFLHAWQARGLEASSYAKYKKCVNRLSEWLYKNRILHADIRSIKQDHIEAFLKDGRDTYKFSNREYNNTFDFIRTCFNYLVKKEYISKSPCAGIDKLKTSSTKHRFYDEDSLKKITKALLSADPYTYLACQTVYYLCIRSDKELMNLKVGNINWEQNKIFLEAGGTKGKSARYIPMDSHIKDLLLANGIKNYSPDFYVFGIKGTPAAESFGTGFFSKRFRKVRDAAELPDHFTIYGFKHTRVVHLKLDGVNDADIMSVTGHKDFSAYAKYLRDLGMSADITKINEKSRKI